jgi:hypothetical protein
LYFAPPSLHVRSVPGSPLFLRTQKIQNTSPAEMSRGGQKGGDESI